VQEIRLLLRDARWLYNQVLSQVVPARGRASEGAMPTMPGFVFRKIDPRPEELEAALDEIVKQGMRDLERRGIDMPNQFDYPDWDGLFTRVAEEPEGGVRVEHWTLNWRHPPGVVIGAVWWTDAVGRHHWYLEEALADERSSFQSSSSPSEARDLSNNDRHPLEWLVNPLSCGWRERNGKREFMVVCGCGVAGAPAEVAWTGECCGPCFDQRQDGLAVSDQPPGRPAIGRVDRFALAPGGTLITVAEDEESPGGSTVKAWEMPWMSPRPLWSRRLHERVENVAICHDSWVAVSDGLTSLILLDLATGAHRDVKQGEAFSELYSLSFVPRVGMLAGVRSRWESELCVWDGVKDGKLGPLRHRELAGFSALAIQPNGIRVVLDNRQAHLEVREVISGRLIEKLRLPGSGHVLSIALAPDATVLAVGRTASPPNESFLACWPPVPTTTSTSTGLGGWLSRMPERPPLVSKRLDGDARFLTLSADGRIVAGLLGPALALWDVSTLAELARFSPPVQVLGPIAFAPDGQSLLANTTAGLAVWPWRELLGADRFRPLPI
jgi:hypothetical protein